MRLRYALDVQEFIRVLSPSAKRAVRQAIDLLKVDVFHPDLDLKALRKESSEKFYRARVGDYRIVYSPRPDHTYIWRIQHRSDGYDWLERMDP